MQANEYRLGYRADLEGLRAVAILLVVAAHAGVPWLAGGFVGVDVFFVLSGFLITGLLLRELAGSDSIRFGEFYVRRLRRLLPGLLAMLLVVGVLAAMLLAPGAQQTQAIAAATATFWLSNLHFAFGQLDYFSSGAESNLFLHTWSLGVEEQFYLLWPALLLWLWGRRAGQRAPRLRRLKIGMGVIAVASLAACVVLTYFAPRLAFYMMPLRAWQFAGGALVWLCLGGTGAGDAPPTHSRLGAVGWLGLAAILAAALWLTPAMAYPGGWAMLPTLGAVAMIAAGVRGAGVSRVLGWWPLQALGRVSYAWYLWHWPMLLLGHALYASNGPLIRAGAVMVSLVLAVISYRLVEAPTRHRRIWLVRPRMTVVVSLAAMVLASMGCARWFDRASDLDQSPGYRRLASAHVDAPVIYLMGCDERYSSDAMKPCSFGKADAPHTAVLLGDSIAGQWFPAVARAYDKPDWRLIVITKSACPMVDEPIFYPRIGRMYTECSAWRRRAVDYLVRTRPDVIVMGSSTYDLSASQWIGGSARILAPLSAAAGHVYVLRSTPHPPFNGPDCLAAHTGRPTWLASLASCAAPARDAATNEAIYGWLKQASRGLANVSLIDLNDRVCPSGVCRAQRDGLIVFRDALHMTASFAKSLSPALAARLQQKAMAGN